MLISSTDVLDGAMIILATFTLNFLYPGLLLGKASEWLSQGGKKDKHADQDTLEDDSKHPSAEKHSSETQP